MKNLSDFCTSGSSFEGFEAVGALRFKTVALAPSESKTYIIALGINEDLKETENYAKNFCREEAFNKALKENIHFWNNKLEGLSFSSGDKNLDKWMKWVTLQPILRRIYGPS